MKKLLLVLIALCIFAAPVLAVDELSGLNEKQLLAIYDALIAEIQKRNINTALSNPRDNQYVFGENVHVQTGQLSVCLPTSVPEIANNPVVLPVVPTATPVVMVGDKATFDSQSPQDGTHVQPGQVFDITWNLLNTGTTTWTTDYVLRFFSGTNFTKPGKTRYPLTNPVPPNTVGACTVDAVAPKQSGTYTMAVVLGNENDENFMVVDITIVVD